MEVVCGAGNPVEMQNCAHYARKHQMLASVGSDYHGPQHHAWLQLGKLPSLPQGLDPVWEQWGDDG
jgi:predicted metal-dependent phosphoesterase TrpH